jgi:hypothetical protein
LVDYWFFIEITSDSLAAILTLFLAYCKSLLDF